MEENPTRICELIVGLGDVEVLGVDDAPGGRWGYTSGLGRAGVWRLRRVSVVQGRQPGGVGGSVPAFGRPVRLMWHKWVLREYVGWGCS